MPIDEYLIFGGIMAKIIDITPRLKTVAQNQSETGGADDHKLLNLQEFQGTGKLTLIKERRQIERTVLSDLVSGMIVLPEKGLSKVTLFDISEEGLSFEMTPGLGSFKVGEEIALRVYLNHKIYFPLQVVIKHATYDTQEGVIRHGVEYMKSDAPDVALRHFVNFIISVNQGLKIDDGDLVATPIF